MPVESLAIDYPGSGTYFHPLEFSPKAAFLCSTRQTADAVTNNNNSNGAQFAMSFVNEAGTKRYASAEWSPITILGQGTLGSSRVASTGTAILNPTFTNCGFEITDGGSGFRNPWRTCGLVFGGDNFQNAIGTFTLSHTGSSTTVSGLPFSPTGLLIIRAGGTGSGAMLAFGVSNGSSEWCGGYMIRPATWGGGDPGFSVGNIHGEMFNTGCAAIVHENNESQYRTYAATFTGDGFTMTGTGTMPTDATAPWTYYYLAWYDPAGECDVGTIDVTGSGTYGVTGGMTDPDALLVGRFTRKYNRERMIESTSQMVDYTGGYPLQIIGTDDRWPGTDPIPRANAWAHYVQAADGFARGVVSNGYMGGYSHDNLIGWTESLSAGLAANYPWGPKISMSVDRGAGNGVLSNGFQLGVTSDPGNHKVGWMLCKTGTQVDTPPCRTPDFIPQIYRMVRHP